MGVKVSRNAFPQRAINDFLRRVDDDAAALALHQDALKMGTPALAELAAVRTIAHGLAGASGIFGFPAISDAAAALEETIVSEAAGTAFVEQLACAIGHLLACIEANRTYRQEPLDTGFDA